MNDLLQQLHKIVPAFNVASIPKDSTGVFASPVHIIAGLIDVTPVYIQKIINDICANVNANCTKMKVTVNGTAQRNKIMVGDAKSMMRVLASCSRQDMAAIVARLPVVASALQAPGVTPAQPPHLAAPAQRAPAVNVPARPPPSVAPAPRSPDGAQVLQAPVVAPAPQAPSVAMDVDGISANDLQDDGDLAIQNHFDFVPAQMVEFVLELNGSKFYIPVRRDGYVNVTKICQAAGKRLQHYKESPAGKEYMEFLQNRNLAKSDSRNPAITLLTSCKGNSSAIIQGTFAHPDLAMAIAMWAHPPFLAEVSGWIRELLITGRVELGKEKSGPELKQKLEETFQAVDEDTKAFLREKNCLELSLLRIECSKRQREDAAAEEERVAKRQRDDYDNAKRQREDAAADDKTKEESRMQLVRFDAEIAFQAKMSAEDLNLKRLECAKSIVEFNSNCLPMLTNSFKESLEKNALLRSAMNDIEVNLARKINKCITGDDSGSSGYQETLYCNDFQTFLREMKLPVATTSQLSALGAFVSKKYKEANNNNMPEKTTKIVNNTNCQVNAYRIEHKDFIEKCIREFYEKATTSTTGAAPDFSVAKPLKDMRSFFGQFNCVNVINNK